MCMQVSTLARVTLDHALPDPEPAAPRFPSAPTIWPRWWPSFCDMPMGAGAAHVSAFSGTSAAPDGMPPLPSWRTYASSQD